MKQEKAANNLTWTKTIQPSRCSPSTRKGGIKEDANEDIALMIGCQEDPISIILGPWVEQLFPMQLTPLHVRRRTLQV